MRTKYKLNIVAPSLLSQVYPFYLESLRFRVLFRPTTLFIVYRILSNVLKVLMYPVQI